MSRVERLAMVARGRADLSVRRQGALLGLARSGVYRTANIAGCRRNRGDAVDRTALSGDTVLWLATNDGGVAPAGHLVNRKRVQRLTRVIGLEALGPKPKTSRPAPHHRIYPYLLRGLTIDQSNQVARRVVGRRHH
jgi:putative transposase